MLGNLGIDLEEVGVLFFSLVVFGFLFNLH